MSKIFSNLLNFFGVNRIFGFVSDALKEIYNQRPYHVELVFAYENLKYWLWKEYFMSKEIVMVGML